jgi:CheY-like chemotaxis protein
MNSEPDPVILLVEDDSNDILLFRRAFAMANPRATLTVVEDAEMAQDYLIRQEPDGSGLPCFVLMDLKLPGRSGMELLGWIRSRKSLRALVVVAFTSSCEDKDLRLAYDLGVNSFLVKPTGAEALFATVKALCDYWINLNERVSPRALGNPSSLQERT